MTTRAIHTVGSGKWRLCIVWEFCWLQIDKHRIKCYIFQTFQIVKIHICREISVERWLTTLEFVQWIFNYMSRCDIIWTLEWCIFIWRWCENNFFLHQKIWKCGKTNLSGGDVWHLVFKYPLCGFQSKINNRWMKIIYKHWLMLLKWIVTWILHK